MQNLSINSSINMNLSKLYYISDKSYQELDVFQVAKEQIQAEIPQKIVEVFTILGLVMVITNIIFMLWHDRIVMVLSYGFNISPKLIYDLMFLQSVAFSIMIVCVGVRLLFL